MKISKSIIKLLKRSSLTLLIAFSAGCTSSSYKISKEYIGRYELNVTPDRIVLNCENLKTEDIVSYGFSIFILDDQNTVLPVVQTNRIGKSDCKKRLKIIGNILSSGNRIYVAGIGDLKSPRKLNDHKVYFPKHGDFNVNGRHLQFHAIANEYGQCFDAYHEARKPCPRSEFPIKEVDKVESAKPKGAI